MQSELRDDYWRTCAGDILLEDLTEKLNRYAHGRLLDAGAGDLLYRPIIEPHCETYESLDICDNPDLDYRQDIQAMDLPTNSFDTVFCRNVLEHVPRPDDALEEINRVLRDDGTAILSVPHLAYLHNEPHDYYRFTHHGIEHLAEQAGFRVVKWNSVGGLFSFLGYVFSTATLGLTYHRALLSRLALSLNFAVQ
jgi:SAM-dependent methyltransferase